MPGFSSWKEPYRAAVTETNKERLTELVHAAEGAIFLRSRELADHAGHYQERMDIREACKGLLSIQVNKLGWPCSIPVKRK